MGTAIPVSQREKILILGDYQTGKTTLAKFLLASMPRRMVWDPTFAFGDRQRNWESFKRFFSQYGKATFQPGRVNLEDKFDGFCEYALSQSNAMVFVDEPAMVQHHPQSFSDLHRLGHKRGLGVTVASHSVWDLGHVFQQYHHLFVFRITRIVDLNALRQLLPEEAVEKVQTLPDWHFIHRDSQGWKPYSPLKPGASIARKGKTYRQSPSSFPGEE